VVDGMGLVGKNFKHASVDWKKEAQFRLCIEGVATAICERDKELVSEQLAYATAIATANDTSGAYVCVDADMEEAEDQYPAFVKKVGNFVQTVLDKVTGEHANLQLRIEKAKKLAKDAHADTLFVAPPLDVLPIDIDGNLKTIRFCISGANMPAVNLKEETQNAAGGLNNQVDIQHLDDTIPEVLETEVDAMSQYFAELESHRVDPPPVSFNPRGTKGWDVPANEMAVLLKGFDTKGPSKLITIHLDSESLDGSHSYMKNFSKAHMMHTGLGPEGKNHHGLRRGRNGAVKVSYSGVLPPDLTLLGSSFRVAREGLHQSGVLIVVMEPSTYAHQIITTGEMKRAAYSRLAVTTNDVQLAAIENGFHRTQVVSSLFKFVC
jgi:hypothetical protein